MTTTFSPPNGTTTWAGYRLLHVRGHGSFGQVWEAEAPDGRKVAFKSVECRLIVPAQELRNTRNVSQLQHPNLVQIEKMWCERDHLIFVMELGDGSLMDLAEVSHQEFGIPLPADLVCGYLRQAAEGLDFLNARTHRLSGVVVGVQHCDIKPNNMLICGDNLKLCDFGLASVTSGPVVRRHCAGTPAYAAPEVFQGRLSEWTDQYALAVVYCQLRGGRLPFPDTPPDFRPDYVRPTPDLDMLEPAERPIIARALSPVPQDRWPNCREMMRQLTAVTGARAGQKLPERRQRGRRTCPHRPLLRLMTVKAPKGLPAKVVDISRNGLGLELSVPLGVGTTFLFPTAARGRDGSRLVSAQVVRSTLMPDGSWFVGCRLKSTLSDGEFETIAGAPPESLLEIALD